MGPWIVFPHETKSWKDFWDLLGIPKLVQI